MSLIVDADASEVRRYIKVFAGRTDAYVRWTGTHYVTIREPLTADVVLTALRDRRPVGGYFLRPDSRSHVAALDFDSWRRDVAALGDPHHIYHPLQPSAIGR